MEMSSKLYQYAFNPPSFDECPGREFFQPPFFTNPNDIPSKIPDIRGKQAKLVINNISDLYEFEGMFQNCGLLNWQVILKALNGTDVDSSVSGSLKEEKSHVYTPVMHPPSVERFNYWMKGKSIMKSEFNRKVAVDSKKDLLNDEDSSNKCKNKHLSKAVRVSNLKTPDRSIFHKSPMLDPTLRKDLVRKASTPLTINSNSKGFDSKLCLKKRRVSWECGSDLSRDLSLNDNLITVSPISQSQSPVDNLSPLETKDLPSRQKGKSRKSLMNTTFSVSQNARLLSISEDVPLQISDDSDGSDVSIIESSQPPYCDDDMGLCLIERSPSFGSDEYDPSIIEISQTPPLFSLNMRSDSKCSSTSQMSDSSFRRQLLNTQFRHQFLTPSCNSSSQYFKDAHSNSFGFRYNSQNLHDAKAIHEHEFLTIICVECHVATRPQLRPDPRSDSIFAIIFSIHQDIPEAINEDLNGIIIVDGEYYNFDTLYEFGDVNFLHVDTEVLALEELVNLVEKWNPDMLIGYEVQLSSWGYILERAQFLHMDLVTRLSRIPSDKSSHFKDDLDIYGSEHTHQIHITGRLILNVWRLMKAEVTLTRYTLENVCFHVLHSRIPSYSYDLLTQWWESKKERMRCLSHYLNRCSLTLQLINKLDLITRTSELARLFGIQFYDVFSRGSQFRVESMMLRLCRNSNYVAISPSVIQRSQMKGPEWIQLVMEPESNFYTDPIAVLDFQSLYPSIMIAYNYCYSTCLGRVEDLGESDELFKFGCSYLKIDPDYLLSIFDHINISPCGVAFVDQSIREGVIPQMLNEILATRLMVKKAIKQNKDDPSLYRVLDSRQLGLKLIANVTYGYTSANFSGRMACIEVADSVVSKGRETLETAIELVESTKKWGGHVVYGDTDSLFVHLPGKTKEEAFKIGREIADEVTLINPKPVKLKFEKVYLPCVLLSKKRYVGYMFETEDQKEPIFDAKGIETVRRDGCPVVQKIMEKSLRVIFDTSNISLAKAYILRQFTKILKGPSEIHDFIFAKEYRGRKGYKPGACVPALELSKIWSQGDPRREPRVGERVPYVVIYGAPGAPLIKLIRSPEILLSDRPVRLNGIYYITKAIIPPLQRVFTLLGLDVNKWFQDMPRPNYLMNDANFINKDDLKASSSSIWQYFVSTTCLSCENKQITIQTNQSKLSLEASLCSNCLSFPQIVALSLYEKIHKRQKQLMNVKLICGACCGFHYNGSYCNSIECPNLYAHSHAVRDFNGNSRYEAVLKNMEDSF